MSACQRKPVVVRGSFVRVATVGQITVLETKDGNARRLYVTHLEWMPALDPISVARIRQVWAAGAFDATELATMYGTSPSTVKACTEGRDAFRGLPPVRWGSAVTDESASYVHLRYGEASVRLAERSPS